MGAVPAPPASPFPHPTPMQMHPGTPPQGVVVQPPQAMAAPFALGSHSGYVSGVSPTATFVPSQGTPSPFLAAAPASSGH
eukprot:13879415-Alexandrium_andersonii.AAC.1